MYGGEEKQADILSSRGLLPSGEWGRGRSKGLEVDDAAETP